MKVSAIERKMKIVHFPHASNDYAQYQFHRKEERKYFSFTLGILISTTVQIN
jgi:hypothetical protein